MTKQKSKILAALLILATISADLSAENYISLPMNKLMFIQQQLEISVEIAANQEDRERGLMHRSQLPEKQGMLFVYSDLAPRSIWMKNTLLPLDVLFLAADGSILTMLNNLPSCQMDPCPVYESKAPAMYILELNAGFIKHNLLKIGQKLKLP
jgi:uncharacterized membrane protein (UPF0127 family)